VKVRFTPSARQQFLHGLAYIRRDKPSAARHFRQRTARVLRRIEDFPHAGCPIPEFPELPHREIIMSSYRFFYRVEKKTVWIVAVWHSAQDITTAESSA